MKFVKRVVGLPGDRITLRDGRVVRNGRQMREPFIEACRGIGSSCDFPRALTVPAGMYYVLGDNRGESDDSRFWGAVPRDAIVGRARVAR